jgi:cell division protein FtsN
MEAETGVSRHKEDGMPPWLPIVLLVLVVGGGGGLLFAMRSGAEHEKAEAAKKAEVARADSIASARADSIKLAAARDSVTAAQLAAGQKPGAAKPETPAAGTTRPTTAQAKTTAAATKPAAATKSAAKAGAAAATAATASAEPAAPAAPKESGPFGIQVASYIVEDKATSEKERLATATGLAGQVKTEDGSYVVLLGSFKTRAAAERAAEPLLSKALVSEAMVVALGKP